MADNTAIEWTDATWNPITGCSVVSPGCTNCYAMRLAGTRLKNVASRKGLTKPTKAGPVWTGEVRFNEAELLRPLSWRSPRKIFACAHGDLFHPDVPDEWIDQTFAVAALCPQHIVQVLTKRSARMRAYISDPTVVRRVYHLVCDLAVEHGPGAVLIAPGSDERLAPAGLRVFLDTWPLPNVWLGVSAEDQARADERIPVLLATPAAVRWLSAEPLLGPIDLNHIKFADEVTPSGGGFQAWESALNGKRFDVWGDGPDIEGQPRLDWVVAGGESGPGARPMHPDWVRRLRDQCADARVPFLLKQWGSWKPISQMAEAEYDALYTPPSTANPERRRRCKVGLTVLHNNGARFDAAGSGAFLSGNSAMTMFEVGKKAAGRLLDGVLHDAYPEVR